MLGFNKNCAGFAKYVRIDVCVIGVVMSLYRPLLRNVLLGVRDTLLSVLIRALYYASLQCIGVVRCRTPKREDEPKCGSCFFWRLAVTVDINLNTVSI